ncbi:MAG: redoxin domain-containing protein, partial [Alphaproteobacteria bacterium]
MKAKLISVALASVAAAAIIGVGLSANGQTVGAIAVAAQVKVAERAEDFRLVDHKSKTQLLSYYKNAPAVVIIAQQNGAKAFRDSAGEIKALQAAFGAKEVPVLLLNSTSADNRDSIAAEMKSIGLDAPVLIDDTQLVGESLGVSRVAQAFVIQPKTWKIVYSGPISADKKTYVADAVSSLIAGTPVKVSTAEIKTPLIAFPNRDRKADFAKISYQNDIAPILAKN